MKVEENCMRSKFLRILTSLCLILAVAVVSIDAHPKTVRISVTKNGFSPGSLNAEVGSPLTLIFTRRSREGCGDKVVIPSLGITRNLPLGKPVTIKITPRSEGTITFSCGMNMHKGSIVVQEH